MVMVMVGYGYGYGYGSKKKIMHFQRNRALLGIKYKWERSEEFVLSLWNLLCSETSSSEIGDVKLRMNYAMCVLC